MPVSPIPLNGAAALERLLAGNRRYVAMRQLHPRQTPAHRQTLVEGQHPIAAVLSCSDSRVPSELIFDQGLGDLFIVRMAGHAVNELVLASLEFAVHVLQVPLVLVVGHEQCGAVAAAIRDQPAPGHIPALARALQPAVTAARELPGDLLENAIRSNARLTAGQITADSPVLQAAVADGRVTIAAAYYDLHTGSVELIPPV